MRTLTNDSVPGMILSCSAAETYSSITRVKMCSFLVALIISISLSDLSFNQSGWLGSSTDAEVEAVAPPFAC